LNAVQTLFIFGTNRAALESVFQELDQEKEKAEGVELALETNSAAIAGRTLLVPTYRAGNVALIEQRAPRKFELPADELKLLQDYLAYLGDERLVLAHHDLMPRQIGCLDATLATPETFFNTNTGKRFGNVNILLPRLTRYLDLVPSELDGFKSLETEINHYQHIRVVRVLLKDIEELRRKIQAVQEYRDPAAQETMLREHYQQGKLDLDAYTAAIKDIARVSAEEIFAPPNKPRLKIKNLAAHYYLPLLLSDDEKIDYISHVIRVPSEVRFIEQLEAYLKEQGNLFAAAFDWWMFSRTDETLDRIYIPYIDSTQNPREFHPDFIFWLKRFDDYFILFVDPKGMEHTAHIRKIEGYRNIFTENDRKTLRVFNHDGIKVHVALALVTTDANLALPEYKDFWFDHPKGILKRLIGVQ
jgi:hypothetical protein